MVIMGSSKIPNGKKLGSFTVRASPGSNQMTFGDLDPSGMAGEIAYFRCHKGESTILAFHRSFIDYYGITHDVL